MCNLKSSLEIINISSEGKVFIADEIAGKL